MQHVVHGRLGRDRAAVPAGQRDRQQAQLPWRSRRPASTLAALAVGGHAERDVARARPSYADLVGEDLRHALPRGHPGHRGDVGGQRDRGQRPLAHDHRVHELHRDVLRVRAGPAGAEHHQLAALVEADRHGVTGLGHRVGLGGQVASGASRRPNGAG